MNRVSVLLLAVVLMANSGTYAVEEQRYFVHEQRRLQNVESWNAVCLEALTVGTMAGDRVRSDHIIAFQEWNGPVELFQEETDIKVVWDDKHFIIPDARITDLNRSGRIKRSVYIEARVRHNVNAPWSCASVVGRFRALDYEHIAYRHRRFRANIYRSNWYGIETVAEWPVWVEFYDARDWDGTNPTLDNIHIVDTTTVLVDARRMNPWEKIFFWETGSTTEPALFDDEPVKWLWPDPNKIVEITLEPGYYAAATRRAIRGPNDGPELFDRLAGEFIIEY